MSNYNKVSDDLSEILKVNTTSELEGDKTVLEHEYLTKKDSSMFFRSLTKKLNSKNKINIGTDDFELTNM